MLQKAIIACCAILIIIIVLFLATKHQEAYVVYDDTKLVSINKCGRSLAFPYFRSANILASERAITDSEIVTYPAGKCITGQNNACNVSEGYAILYENDIFYVLKKACLRLNAHSVSMQGSTLSAIIRMQQEDDIKNICTFMTLNPLWVEFHTDKRTTLAYKPIFHRSFSTDKTTYTLKFVPVQHYNSTNDPLFNYKSYDANKQTPHELQHRELKPTELLDRLDMSVYYLDRMDVAFQSISTVMNLNYNEQGSTVIYDPQYKEKDSCASQQEFMQNISLMLQNMYTPVLTFQWQIGVTSLATNKVVIKAYMDNTIGTYKSCVKYNDFGDQKNNIFSGAVKTYDDTTFILDLFTGSSNGTSCFFPATAVSLHLPYLPETQMINIVYTMTPYECIAYAEWMNTTAGKYSKSMTLSKRQSCASSQNNSALYTLFKARNTVGLAPIYLKYDTNVVKKLFTCTQGFVNMYRTFANFS